MLPWTKLPIQWIFEDGLRAFRWSAGEGGKEVSALLVLAVLGHHATEGSVKLTYDDLGAKLGISRTMISAGLAILESRGIVERGDSRSTYFLVGGDQAGVWAKLPAKGMYVGGLVVGFRTFTLRNPAELNALKLYFLFAAMRDTDTNAAQISYDKIVDRTAIRREAIPSALSLLAANGLVRLESVLSESARTSRGEAVAFHRYRLAHLDSYHHAGTAGRAEASGLPVVNA